MVYSLLYLLKQTAFFLILCWTFLFCECVFMKHVQAHMSDSIPVNRKSCIASEFPMTSYTQIVW